MTPESALKHQILEILLHLNFIVIRLNSGGAFGVPCNLLYLPPEMIARRAGVPDLLAVSPDGQHYWIDTKATRKPSAAQIEFATVMRARGDTCLFPRSVDELMEGLQP